MKIEEFLSIIKKCYAVLVVETENKRIMDTRLEKILIETANVWEKYYVSYMFNVHRNT